MSDALRQLQDAANVLAESGLRTVKTNDLCIAVYGAIDEITRLREAMEEYVNTVVKMEGVTFVDQMENAELRAVVESILAEKEK